MWSFCRTDYPYIIGTAYILNMSDGKKEFSQSSFPSYQNIKFLWLWPKVSTSAFVVILHILR
jgi:hypothetical protein